MSFFDEFHPQNQAILSDYQDGRVFETIKEVDFR